MLEAWPKRFGRGPKINASTEFTESSRITGTLNDRNPTITKDDSCKGENRIIFDGFAEAIQDVPSRLQNWSLDEGTYPGHQSKGIGVESTYRLTNVVQILRELDFLLGEAKQYAVSLYLSCVMKMAVQYAWIIIWLL